jgi:hypothetical protein
MVQSALKVVQRILTVAVREICGPLRLIWREPRKPESKIS